MGRGGALGGAAWPDVTRRGGAAAPYRHERGALPARAWRAFVERFPATRDGRSDPAGPGRHRPRQAADCGGLRSGAGGRLELSGLALRHRFDRRQCRRVGADVGAGRSRPALPGRSLDLRAGALAARAAPRCWAGSARRTAALLRRSARAARRVAGRFADSACTPVCALELEFYLLARSRSRGRPRAPAAPPGDAGEATPAGLRPRSARRAERFLRCLALLRGPGAARQGRGLRVRDRPVRGQSRPCRRPAAGRRSRFPAQTRDQGGGRGRGLLATFMAKPFADRVRQRPARPCQPE